MKTFLPLVCFPAIMALALGGRLAAQPTTNVPLGSVRAVSSSHSTSSDGIQSWSSVSLQSPSGHWYADDTYDGLGRPDGSSSTSVSLNETGGWTVWYGGGYDAPQAGTSYETIGEFLNVQPVAPPNRAPSIAWSSALSSAGSGQVYTISVHGHDDDGNLAQVNVWKNGQPFAFAGGGNGTDGDSGNPSADSGPQTITYTAQAVDSDGATSATISQTVTVSAPVPVNRAPVIAWNTKVGTVASGKGYSISAHGHDADGNLAQVNVWKNGFPFAFAGGGNGADGDSGNPTADAGPVTITFTAQAVDADGAASPMISQTVTVNAPPPVNQAPTIAWNATVGTVASGQTYTISAHGHDADGNLTQVSVWRNGTPFAFAGGGNGTDGDSGNPATDGGPQVITYTAQAVDSNGATSATISQTVTVSAPLPVNHPPTIAWVAAPVSVPSGQNYSVTAHGHDDDGNLAQVKLWKNGSPFAFAGGGNGTDGDSGNSATDSGPQVITFTAQAVDSNGFASATISQTVMVSAPPPVSLTLATAAGAGGAVSPGGSYQTGTVVAVTATPDSVHDFVGWSGDAAGTANPVTVVLDRDKSVQANFALKSFALTTIATGGGSVTPGGVYPYGAVVTLAAVPDAVSRFAGWSGDATGSAASVAVTMTAARSVQALFNSKAPQAISFAAPADRNADSPAFSLSATATSGLPVSYAVLSGPATISSDRVQLTGFGAVTIQALQPGDDTYLPAPAVARTFNAVAPAILKYRSAARTVLQRSAAVGPTSLVLEQP